MRKVLVFGSAFAAAALSAVALPVEAGAEPPRPPQPVAPVNESAAVIGSAPATARAVMVTAPIPNKATYAYGSNSRQRIDVYWRGSQRSAKTRPGVLLLHGGYWRAGDKSSWKYTARKLVAEGYTVFAPNYRLTPKHRWPSQRDDALAALAFAKRNAARWNTDGSRIVAMGSSAGGQLATQLGTYASGGKRVRGVVALSPVNTPYLAYQDGGKVSATVAKQRLREAVVALVGCTPGEADEACWSRLDDATSTTHVTAASAPMLLLHSVNEFVPVTQSLGLANALRAAGVPAIVRTVPGAEHGGAVLRDERTFRAVVTWMDSVAKR